MAANNLVLLSVVVNFLSALGVLWIMQVTTSEAGLHSRLAVLKLVHRTSLACLALALFYNAAETLESNTPPRLVDLTVQLSLLAAISISAMRHAAASPQSASGTTAATRSPNRSYP